MNITFNRFSSKGTGVVMLLSALLMVLTILNHPHGITDSSANNLLLKFVHGILIFLLIFNTFGVRRFIKKIDVKHDNLALGMLFYYLGLGSLIMAMLISGFVQTSLPNFFSWQSEMHLSLNKFSTILNQVFAKFGLISLGTAAIILSLLLIADQKISRPLCVTGFVVGISLIIPILAGLYLSVLSMTVLTVLIVIWHVSIAIWLVKN